MSKTQNYYKAPIIGITLIFVGYFLVAFLTFFTTPKSSTASNTFTSSTAQNAASVPVAPRKSIFSISSTAGKSITDSAASSPAQGIIRRTWIEPGSSYMESAFYLNGEIIARQRISPGGIIEQTGSIPDGKIKFFNASDNSYGEEYYKNGKKTQISRTYYESGQLKSEARYRPGKLIDDKDYYKNGALRFQGDYEDARDIKNNDPEVGIGKLYYEDGILKYEWHLTKSEKTGFKKTYNRKGDLIFEVNFDEDGNVIKNQ